ncbi:NAD(P)-binding protein [Polyplosphaeria fusca]|uniref:NAD(P)-binding protein n=1 Tax=Polyplosphaeria fusca TaxID=682080 RepID=A0A9P4UVV5_9PLEO|nr:NAD(P)-binding protein [Polyplosphaeria fusca]
MSPAPKKIGLIGLSAKGSKHSAETAAKQFSLGSVATYDNPISIANDPNVDIVAVSVNVPEHYDLIKPALEAGKDTFAEWPLARNLKDAEELTSLAKSKGVRTLIGLQARQNPTVIKAKQMVESGKLGKIIGTDIYAHGFFFGPVVPENLLYSTPIENGANLLTIPFGHTIDALCFILGEMDSLSATLSNHYPEQTIIGADGKPSGGKANKTAHDYISITGTTIGGANVDVTFASGASRTGRNFYWEINGTEGSLVMKADMGIPQMYQPSLEYFDNEGKTEQVEVEKAGDFDKGDFSFNVGKAWEAWAGVGLDQGYSVTTFEDALLRHKMIDAIYRSAEKGTRERYL